VRLLSHCPSRGPLPSSSFPPPSPAVTHRALAHLAPPPPPLAGLSGSDLIEFLADTDAELTEAMEIVLTGPTNKTPGAGEKGAGPNKALGWHTKRCKRTATYIVDGIVKIHEVRMMHDGGGLQPHPPALPSGIRIATPPARSSPPVSRQLTTPLHPPPILRFLKGPDPMARRIPRATLSRRTRASRTCSS
jgi:hypothetical protein